MNRIEQIFSAAGNSPSAAYMVAGYPDMAESVAKADAAIDSGASIIFIGAPFSEPMADAPIIAAHAQIAAAQGKGIREALQTAATLRAKHPECVLVLNSYTNLLLKFGIEELCREMAEAGFDALDVSDLPFEEHGELLTRCRAAGLHLISTVYPAGDLKRAAEIAANATGFLKCLGPAGGLLQQTDLPILQADSVKYMG